MGIVSGGGGGGSQTLQVATVAVTSAEIKALFTAPKTLIAAPGAGKLLTVQGYCLQFIAGNTPYATVTDVGLQWEGGAGVTFGGSLLDQATNQITLDDLVYSGPQSAVANKALQLTADGANPTAGNGTIVLTIYYTVVTLS
jgi:hypothetical protein